MADFIRSLPPDGFGFFVAFTVGLILLSLYFFQRGLKHGRLMEDMPTSRIRSAAQGYVELEGRGKMMPGEPVIALLSRDQCVWWKYRVTERYKDTRTGRTRYRNVESGDSDALFLLNDGTGECIVDPDGAEIRHAVKQTWNGTTARPISGPRHTMFGLFARYRYEEWLIRQGDPVYAIGHFRTQSAVAGHFDEQAELNELMREWKQDQDLLMQRFDVNKDGRIDATEWEAARRVALKQLRRDLIEQELPPGLHVLSRPTDGKPFLISGIAQHKLIGRQRLVTGAALLSFLSLIGYLVWAFGLRAG